MQSIPWRDMLYTILALIIIYFLSQHSHKPDVEPKPILNNYKTDTITPHYHFHFNQDPKGIVVNPHIVVEYPKEVTHGVSVQLRDSLLMVIDSLNKQMTTINLEYLKQHPKASKLLSGKFTQDSLSLDLLNTQGSIESLRYPVSYSAFQYEYVEGTLRANPVKGKHKPPSKFTTRILAYGGYDPIWRSPLISGEYNVEYGRVNIKAEPIFYLNQNPKMFLQGKLGYRFK